MDLCVRGTGPYSHDFRVFTASELKVEISYLGSIQATHLPLGQFS